MSKKGRSSRLLKKRDNKLLERYYYWSEVKRIRFDDVIHTLSEEEFFIEEKTIERIICRNNEQLNAMIEARKNPKQLSLFNNI